MSKKLINSYFLVILLGLFLNGCNSNKKDEGLIKKDEPINMKERILARNDGMIFNSAKNAIGGGRQYEFATSNVLWRATLESLKEIPILSANYSGGLLVTDWIDVSQKGQSYKIQVTFKSNELSTNSIEIKTFLKTCSENYMSCKVSSGSEKTNEEVKIKILNKARELKIQSSKK